MKIRKKKERQHNQNRLLSEATNLNQMTEHVNTSLQLRQFPSLASLKLQMMKYIRCKCWLRVFQNRMNTPRAKQTIQKYKQRNSDPVNILVVPKNFNNGLTKTFQLQTAILLGLQVWEQWYTGVFHLWTNIHYKSKNQVLVVQVH